MQPFHHPYPTIKDDKISLRQIMPTDIEDIVEISFYDTIQATTFEMAIVMQERIDQDIRDGNSIHWGIIDHSTNKIVGTCGYYRGLDKGEGELGCVLLPQFRGQGFMTNAMQLAIDFGLNNLGLKRIWAITSNENIKAIKLLERLKFIKVVDLEDNEIEYELTPQKK
ncbi:GNAT family N-acetyltransferase [Sphingobacterium faecium]|uniref:GNAT family N-acetyltransferase n=1 Tax=Sphingobacterium faecium TaxID=34087 RepID=UPI000F9E0806|nr:GNAT family N-acetyltransferase [Sphingobacterium faecium]MQP28724.1 GNAT family N-acetyltransferase [Sphingobacterium faecium]